MRGWADLAAQIPDEVIRSDALRSITEKRDHVHGAALFWTVPRTRDTVLLRLLVAYQTIWDFLDNLSERAPTRRNGEQLHLALVQALDPEAPISDYYLYHPHRDDGGYLLRLVETCRECCELLPSYQAVRPLVLEGVRRCSVQSLNHDPDDERRVGALREWATREFRSDSHLQWFELTAAASAFTPHPLLALAAESSCTTGDVARVNDAYFPWFALAIAMLDSYADQAEDLAAEQHSYISYYSDSDIATVRVREIVAETMRMARMAPKGTRHNLIASCMIAMYLSREGARTQPRRTQSIASAGGLLTRLLVLLLKGWRETYLRRAVRLGGLMRTIAQLPPSLRLPRPIQTFLFWRWPLKYLEDSRERYGDAFTLYASGHPPLVFLSEEPDIKAVLSAPADVLHPGEGASTILPLVGEQSFMLQEEQWHLSGRRTILPAYSHSAVQHHSEVVSEIAKSAVDSWPLGAPIALHPRLRTLTLQVILHSIFGSEEHGEGQLLLMLRDRLLAMLEVTASPVLSAPALRRGPGSLIWKRFLRQRAEADELIFKLIDECTPENQPEGLLARLCKARNPDGSLMSRQQIRDNVMSIVLAGHETTASELTWAFQLLGHNAGVQRRLIEEIDNEEGEDYLMATVQEVLRHRPVFLFAIPRAVAKTTQIGRWSYRPQAQLLGSIYLLHHDPRLYSDPHSFRPERFLQTPPQAHNWLPWGGGRKRCPGHHLATLEMRTVLRTVLSRATIQPVGRVLEQPRWRSVIITPHRGGRVVLHAREKTAKSSRAGWGAAEPLAQNLPRQNRCPYPNNP